VRLRCKERSLPFILARRLVALCSSMRSAARCAGGHPADGPTDWLAEVLTDDNVETLEHLVRRYGRELALADLKIWADAGTGQPVSWPMT
jgi:hypothetical protein